LPCYDIPGNPPPYYPQGLGGCGDVDLDFGANPNLFRDLSGHKMVGNGQKSGVYHAFDAKTMTRAWSTAVGLPSAVGGIVGSTAYDGTRIYGPVTQGGYLWALDSVRGTNGWVAPVADGAHYGESVAVANGVVYTVDLKGFLDAFDARNGLPLLHRPLLLGSATGANPVLSWGNVSVARHTVYAGVGVTALANGFIIALRPGGGGGSGAPTPGPSLPPLPAGPTVVAGPGAYVSTYATPAVVMPKGGALSFANADVPQHDVTAVKKDSRGKPIFNSKLVGLGEVTPVNGVDKLPSGSYAFYCTIHPGMTGTLAVL
jgi:outer membrane protein assembly factor BamB